MQLAPLYRAAGLVAGALALVLAPAVALDAPTRAAQIAGPPEFGVLQFTDSEAWVDLPVPLAEAWKQTLEVVASLNDSVSADLPYLESNGRIVAGDLWIAVEAAGAPGQTWVRIRVAIPDDEPEYGKVRAEIILDAIADRLEPPAPASNEFSYPLPPVAEGVVGGDYVTNNYYYYDSTPYSQPYYEPYYVPTYVPVYTYAPVYSPWWSSCWGPSWGWGWGWGSPWCGSWGWGWNWGFSVSWGWGSWWGCSPWWFDDCDFDDFDDCDDLVIVGDDVIIVDSKAKGVSALATRPMSLDDLPPGDLASSKHFSRRRETVADAMAGKPDDGLPRVTDRASRRAAEPAPAVVVTRTERSDRSARDVAAVPTDRPTTGTTTRTQTSPSKSSRKDGPVIVKLGSAPYSARVNPAVYDTRSSSVPVVTVGGTYPASTTTSSSGGRTTTSTSGHPYSNPYPTSMPAPSAPSASSRSSSPAPSAPAPVVSQPRPSPSVSQPSSSSRPSVSSSSSGGRSSSGSIGGGSSGGGRSSGGGSSGGGRSSGGSSGGRGPR